MQVLTLTRCDGVTVTREINQIRITNHTLFVRIFCCYCGLRAENMHNVGVYRPTHPNVSVSLTLQGDEGPIDLEENSFVKFNPQVSRREKKQEMHNIHNSGWLYNLPCVA